MKKHLVLAALLAASAPAFAQTPGLYGGISVGQSEVDVGNLERDAVSAFEGAANVTSSSVDDTATAYKAYIGYRYNANFGIEAGYANIGKATGKLGLAEGELTGTLKGEVKSHATFVDLVGFMPISDSFTVFAKVGGAYAYTKLKVSFTDADGEVSDSESDGEVVPKAGLGLEYNLSKTIGLRAEYEKYFDVGDKNKTGEADADIWTVGLRFNF